MIYGNANLLNVPWETIIKECRRSLAERKFDTLEEYGDFLLNFLKENVRFFSSDAQKKRLIYDLVLFFENEVKSKLEDIIDEKFSEEDCLSGEKVVSDFEEIINDIIIRIGEFDYSAEFNDKLKDEIKETYASEFDYVLDCVFEKAIIRDEFRSTLHLLMSEVITKNFPGELDSGIVISGFGEKEIFPSIATYEISSVVLNTIRYRVADESSHKISGADDSTIIPFAQDDMVHAFMNGVSKDVLGTIKNDLDNVFYLIGSLLRSAEIKSVLKSHDEIEKAFEDLVGNMYNGVQESLTKVIQANHSSPVIQMVMSLPKDELASMAESLVSLTAFERRMTGSPETVGGPVDVLVISKGDGLVWINRKLYFPKELNYNFFKNYCIGKEEMTHE